MAYKTSKKRVFKKLTPERLANAALVYLGRYAASEASLRRVLENKIKRAALCDKDFAADHESQQKLYESIDQIVAHHIKNGIINDREFAAMKVASMQRSGKSSRRIAQNLAQKGIDSSLIEDALAPEEGDDPAEMELKAARAHARKRRLGPYRKGGASDDPKIKSKEVASLARAGFSFDVAKQVLGELPEDIFSD